jgi:probable HAF family extracellular repeat protein
MTVTATPSENKPITAGLGSLLPAKIDYHPREICAAFGINNKGQVVGRAAMDESRQEDMGHAFVSVDGRMKDLGVLPGYDGGSCAFAINESGRIVGSSGKEQDDEWIKGTRAFLYENGAMTDLGTLGGDYSKAVAINKSGRIAGISMTSSGGVHVFIYEHGKMRDAGGYKGYKFFRVNGMNDSGEIVGAMSTDRDDEGKSHAFYYKDGMFHDLGVFGGMSGAAHGVNNAGDIVGEFSVNGKAHAFLYSGGKMVDLTGAVDTRKSLGAIATLINNRGEIVMMVPRDDHTTENYIHHGKTTVSLRKLLASSGCVADSVGGINDAGQLICFGSTPGGMAGFVFDAGKVWFK